MSSNQPKYPNNQLELSVCRYINFVNSTSRFVLLNISSYM